MSPDELSELSKEEGAVDRRFSVEMISSLDRWLDMADGKLKGGEIPCLLNGGNDDIFEIDDVIDASPCVTFGEGRLIELGGFHLVSMGWTKPHAVEHLPGGRRRRSLAARSRRSPARYRTWAGRSSTSTRRPWDGLDERPRSTHTCAPYTAAPVMKPVGSTAVRDAIVRHQPCSPCTDTSTRAGASRKWGGPSP
jgi:hypothetical protein